MAPWRALGPILETTGLDFRAPSLDFGGFKSPSLNYSKLDLHLSVYPSVHATDAYIAPKALPKLGGGGVPLQGPSMKLGVFSVIFPADVSHKWEGMCR